MTWLIILLVVGAIGAIGAGASLGGIKQKFADLGTIAGRTRNEIIEKVGPPNSVSGLPDGKTLLQWQHTSSVGAYHIALRFDENDVCEGVTHEYSS